MASYKDLTNTQASRIEALGKYNITVKKIAEQVGVTYNQAYQYFMKNGRSIMNASEMNAAHKAHFTRLQATEKSVKVIVQAKSESAVKFTIPANAKWQMITAEDGSVNIIY